MNVTASNALLRGYRRWTRCAGKGAGEAATFDAMMTAFEADLAAQTTFCQCADDQLVIFLLAHGYGRNGNPAMKFRSPDIAAEKPASLRQ
jgi:hypothetical protein